MLEVILLSYIAIVGDSKFNANFIYLTEIRQILIATFQFIFQIATGIKNLGFFLFILIF